MSRRPFFSSEVEVYRLKIDIHQRDQLVIIDAEMYEQFPDGVDAWLGDIPQCVLGARSKGHDWLGDITTALVTWAEMSIMSRESLFGVSEENGQG